MERGQLQSVFVVEKKFARQRLVTLGAAEGNAVAVLSGLNEGDTVISPIPVGLKDGTPVEVRP